MKDARQEPLYWTTRGHLLEGYASVYNYSVFEATLDWRIGAGQLTESETREVDGYVATLWCGYVGDTAILKYMSKQKKITTKRVLVADCAVRNDSDGTRTWMQENNIVVEVDSVLAEDIPNTKRGRYVTLTVFDTSDLYE